MIPSLLQIPSAVSDSKLHSVLPNNGKGDFTFDRSTGATRINKDGLIEEVGYFSSELVQNGNFSELGSELVTNGDFSTDSDWSKGTGWSIINGKARASGVSGSNNLTQSGILTAGKTYKITITVSEYVSGTVEVSAGASPRGEMTGNGTYTFYQVATPNTSFYIISQVFNGAVDNVSVKQVDPNDRWKLGDYDNTGNTKWSITDKANYDHTASSGTYVNRIVQTGLNIKTGKKYKLTFDVTTTGSTAFWIGNDLGTVNYEGGTYRTFYTGSQTVIFDVPNNQTTLAFYNNNSDATLDNISLVEVQGDRPRLSYDITNGVVDSQPHLLLEPSRTNLVTHSNDITTYSHYNYGGGLIVDSYGYLSPDGTQNASRLVYTNSSTGSGGALLTQNITLNATGTYTISLYAKSISGTKRIRISPKDTGSNGPAGFIIDMTTKWQRFTHTFTNDGNTNRGFQFRIAETEDSGDRTFDVWGMTIEEGSFATSVIPTAGTTITRAAETCNNSKPSVNSTEGVLYCEIAALADDLSFRVLSISDGTTSNNVGIGYRNNSNVIYTFVQSVINSSSSVSVSDIKQFNKVAVKYKSGDFCMYVNGSEVYTSSSSFTLSGLNTSAFDNGAGAADFYGKVKGLAVYNEALSESQLMQLTGVTASSIYSNFVTRTASFTVEALNEVKKAIDNL